MSVRSACSSAAERRSGAERTTWKKALDLLLYLFFCALAGTGFLLAYRLPHGPNADQISFLGFGRHMWGEVHTWMAWATIVVGSIHLSLNLQWLIKVAASKRPWRLAIGILAGLSIVLLFLFAPTSPPR
jgi:hypothetical protein